MFTRLVILFSIPVLTLSVVKAQTAGPVRDPNAVALASKALQAVAGTTALSDITIQAAANYTAGCEQETGTATLVALGNVDSLVTLNLSDGQPGEVRNGIQGVWVGTDGAPHTMLSHNNFVDASWFYPAFTLAALTSDATLGLSLVGQEVHEGQAVFHLVASRVVSRNDPNTVALIQRLSTMHLYLDAATLLPAAFAFNVHPDTDTGRSPALPHPTPPQPPRMARPPPRGLAPRPVETPQRRPRGNPQPSGLSHPLDNLTCPAPEQALCFT